MISVQIKNTQLNFQLRIHAATAHINLDYYSDLRPCIVSSCRNNAISYLKQTVIAIVHSPNRLFIVHADNCVLAKQNKTTIFERTSKIIDVSTIVIVFTNT